MRSRDRSRLSILFFFLLVTQLCSCAATSQPPLGRPTDLPTPPPAEQPAVDRTPQPALETPVDDGTQSGPRAIASLELTTQGKNLLDQGQPDAAIRVFERAIQLNPTNGRNYYYVAEAWLMRKNAAQAREFNYLAELYFAEDPTWLKRVKEQRNRIGNGE